MSGLYVFDAIININKTFRIFNRISIYLEAYNFYNPFIFSSPKIQKQSEKEINLKKKIIFITSSLRLFRGRLYNFCAIVSAYQFPFIFLGTHVMEEKVLQQSAFGKVLSPDFSPHLPTRQNCLRAKLMQVNKNQVTDAKAKLFHPQTLKLLRVFCHHFISDMVRLIITKILQILLIYISFAEFSHSFDVFIEQRYFNISLQEPLHVFGTFLFCPQKRKNLIYNV